MKKLIQPVLIIFFLLSYINDTEGQIKPNSETVAGYSRTQPASVPPYNNTIINSIRTWTPKRPFQDPAEVAAQARTVSEVGRDTKYYDGLGRLLQTVSWQASPSKKDVVQPEYYDSYGRKSRQYMPYSAVLLSQGSNDGNFKASALTDQYNFFTNATYNPDLPGERNFFGEIWFYSGPLDLPWNKMEPGNSWSGNNNGIKHEYETNWPDEVILWNIDKAAGSLPVSSGIFPMGELFRQVSRDENNSYRRAVEFKDKNGRVVLRKSEKERGARSDIDTGWISTYYVYDDDGLLRFIIPPKAVEALRANNWQFTGANWNNNDLAKNLCYINEYDERRNLIRKKTPAAKQIEMVYDARDRMVLSTDPRGRWDYTVYDDQDRETATGTLEGDTHTREYHAALAGNSISYPSYNLNTILTRTFYDDYSWISAYNSTITNSGYEPVIGNNAITTPVSMAPFAVPLVATTMPLRGLVTGKMLRVIDPYNSRSYLFTLNVYDDYNRIIQTKTTNYFNGVDYTTSQYDFSGNELVNHVRNRRPGSPDIAVTTKKEYDAEGRLQRAVKNVNGTYDVQIARHEYNERGQLKKKYLGVERLPNKTYSGIPLETLDYQYNVRGWLTGMNRSYARGETHDNWFGMTLSYDVGFTNPYYNGNISGTEWRSRGDGKQRAYGFVYDLDSRLLKADFTQGTGRTYNTDPLVDFSMKLGDGVNISTAYDVNGNILSLWQKGLKGNSSPVIDDLEYQYMPNTNQLRRITEKGGLVNNKLGDFRGVDSSLWDTEYTYDDNGNCNLDVHHGASLSYNQLNLPNWVELTDPISWEGKGLIYYTYDALGNKLNKTVHDYLANYPNQTYYCDPFTYEQIANNPVKLLYIQQEEGRIVPTYDTANNITDFRYDYFIKDHLGNIRMILTGEKQQSNYIATMESAYRAKENKLFYNIPETSFPVSQVPGGYPVDNTTTPNDSIVRLSAATKIIGPSIILKVMSGDEVGVSVKSFYRSGGNGGPFRDPVADIVRSLATAFVGLAGTGKGNVVELSNMASSPLAPLVQGFWSKNSLLYPRNPSAGLSWILFDEQFNWVDQYPQSGAMTVNQPDVLQTRSLNVPITKNGYLYVYLSNCTYYWDCFFDNMVVNHTIGNMVEETHYYPFGLPMAGISARAPWTIANKFKFNGNEAQEHELMDSTGMDMIDFNARMYDAQTGKFWQSDPETFNQPDVSPYQAMHNNPLLRNDPNGDWDDYWINQDGSMDRVITSDDFDRFILTDQSTPIKNKEGETVATSRSGTLLGQFNKNENGLISLPAKFSATGWGGTFGFTLRPESKDIRYIRGEAFASLLGALALTHTSDLTINGFSKSDGTSKHPSKSHKEGKNGDLRYLRTDKTGEAVTTYQKALDIARQSALNNALYKFGWKDMISERYSRGTLTNQLLPHAASAKERSIGTDHTNHLHLQGYRPTVRKSYVVY